MHKRTSLVVGIGLIGLGILAMGLTASVPLPWLRLWGIFDLWRFWPLSVIGVGAAFVLPPFLYRGRRGLGGLLIPGVPILVNGCMLLLSSVWDWWSAWSWMWPLEVLSVALGFVLAALMMRVLWLLIPAFILGLNGLLFQFCALTGLWEVWAVLWTIEPLSVGLPLLLIGALKRRQGLTTAGLILCIMGGIALVGMASILALSWVWTGWWWVLRYAGPAVLVLAGALLLLQELARRGVEDRAGV